MFSSTRKRKASVFKFLRFEETFEKFRFRDGLVWTVGLIVESISGVVWQPKYSLNGSNIDF